MLLLPYTREFEPGSSYADDNESTTNGAARSLQPYGKIAIPINIGRLQCDPVTSYYTTGLCKLFDMIELRRA